jgi:hypothetical protein
MSGAPDSEGPAAAAEPKERMLGDTGIGIRVLKEG